MKTTHTILAGLAVFTTLGLSAWGSSPTTSNISVVRGTVLTEVAAGRWESSPPAVGAWMKVGKSDAVLRIPGATVRLQAGSKVRVQPSEGKIARIEANSGRVFVKADDGITCQVASRTNKVIAGSGEFLVDTGKEDKLYSVRGGLEVTDRGGKMAVASAKAWQSNVETLALDGPDVRRRNRNRRRFTQGEENKGKRIGEDAPPQSATATPTITETPAYTPTVTPSITATPPSPAPSPSNPPPQATGGDFPVWPVVGGLAGAGLVTYLVTRNNDDEVRIVGPFSP